MPRADIAGLCLDRHDGVNAGDRLRERVCQLGGQRVAAAVAVQIHGQAADADRAQRGLQLRLAEQPDCRDQQQRARADGDRERAQRSAQRILPQIAGSQAEQIDRPHAATSTGVPSVSVSGGERMTAAPALTPSTISVTVSSI